MITSDMLLAKLPAYKGESVLITSDQSVRDIIKEVSDAHIEFAPYYDEIALYFDCGDIDSICAMLYDFCKRNIRYKEEKEEEQTTALPSRILAIGYGDCKHYAGFCGGVLDALNRLKNKKINWCYRFASYDLVDSTPHHVFVVVNIDGEEIWIDPTPNANNMNPMWQLDKKVKTQPMALRRYISGIDAHDALLPFTSSYNSNAIGKADLTLTPRVNQNPLCWNWVCHYPGIFDPYLGLSQYRDEGGDRNLNEEDMASQLNNLIAQGPSPGHTVDPDFIRWVYETNLRSWNFYYAGGVKPGFDPSNQLPAGYPRWIITEDGRLTLSNDVALDDYKNAEIHLMVAWAQALINQYDPTPYPVKPQHVRRFSLMEEGNVNTRNMFTEARGDSIFKEIGKALEDAVNFVKDGIITIVGFAPRNAFLGLVGINAFGFATNMWEKIQAGKWDEMAAKWKKLGGNPDKLHNTIEDGQKKNAILGYVEYGEVIGVEPATTSTATLLALAAPIIAALLAFLDKDGKAREVLSATKTFLQTKYPNLDLTAFGFLDRNTGQYLDFETDPRYDENNGAYNPGTITPPGGGISNFISRNPIPVAAAAGLAVHLLVNKKGRKPNYLYPIAAAGVVFFVLKQMNGSTMQPGTGQLSTAQKKSYLINWVNESGEESAIQHFTNVFNQMSAEELSLMYEWVFNYISKGNYEIPVSFKNQLDILDAKYQIFGT